jgi:hypothetical protein
VTFVAYNKACAGLFNAEKSDILKHRAGDVLHCMYSYDVKEGCGRGPHCATCDIRNAVKAAFLGSATTRRKVRFTRMIEGKREEIHILITASPFVYDSRALALLVIEDISEIITLRGMIPICCRCKKIRNDKEYWTKLEAYLQEHLDLDFTHGYCPECYEAELAAMNHDGITVPDDIPLSETGQEQ